MKIWKGKPANNECNMRSFKVQNQLTKGLVPLKFWSVTIRQGEINKHGVQNLNETHVSYECL